MHDELTAVDMQKMREELREREEVLMPKILEDVKVARSFGDLSENFEYKAAKKYKNQNESRIRYLEKMIKTAIIVEDESGEDEVGLNDTVTIYNIEDDCEETYKLVTTIRSDSLNQIISIESPLGKALVRKKVGDKVNVKINDSYNYDVIIRSICKSDDESEAIRSF